MNEKLLKGIACIMLLICMNTCLAENETDNSLGLSSYYQQVLSYYPLLKKQQALSGESMESKSLAASFKFPRIMVSASYINSNDPVTVFGTLLRQNEFTRDNFDIKKLNNPDPVDNFNMTLYAELPVFNAYQTQYAIRLSEYLNESSKYSEKFIKQQIVLISTETYLNYLLSRETSAMIQKSLKDALTDMEQADELKKKGIVLGADFYAAKVLLSNIEQMLNQYESRVRTSVAVLNILAGKDPKIPVKLTGTLKGPKVSIPEFDLLISRYTELRPDLAAINYAIKAKETEVEKEKSARLPKVSAFASAQADSEKLNDSETNYTAGIRGAFDLFDPGRKHRTGKLRNGLEALKNDETLLKDQILQQIYTIYEEYQTLSKNYKTTQQALWDSKESLKLLEPLYSEGKKSIADLLEMRLINLNAETSCLRTLFETEIKAIDLLFCAGLLEENHINELSSHIEEARV